MIEPHSGWEAWRNAETRIETDGIEAAAGSLTPVLATLLRFTHAVFSGDKAAFEALPADGPNGTILTWIREMACNEPGTLNPTRVRAAAKRAGISNEPFPCLDLLRLMIVAINGERTTASKPLKALARQRDVAAGAVSGLNSAYKCYELRKQIAARSPRFAAVHAASVARRFNFDDVSTCVAPGCSPLTDADWPDLDDRFSASGDGRQGRSRGGLNAFLKDPLGAQWSVVCEREVARKKADDAASCQLLGHLILATNSLLRAGRAAAACPVLGACQSLLQAVPIRQRTVLANALRRLEHRVTILSGNASAEALASTWRASSHLAPEDRAVVAKELLDRTRSHWQGEEDAIGLGFRAGFMGSEPSAHVADVLIGMPAHQARRALEGIDEPRRSIVEAHVQFGTGRHLVAIKLATRALATPGREREARGIVNLVVHSVDESRSAEVDATAREAAQFWTLVAERKLHRRISDEVHLLTLRGLVSEGSQVCLDEALERDQPTRWETEFVEDGFDVPMYIYLVGASRGASAARNSIRQFGRWLIRTEASHAIRVALTAACTSQRGISSPSFKEWVSVRDSLQSSVSSFILRSENSVVESVARELFHEGRIEAYDFSSWAKNFRSTATLS